MSVKDGGHAFPAFQEYERLNDDTGRWEKYSLPEGGMSLRDYFAAKAMESIIAMTWGSETTGEAHVASWAYQQADAMLEQRKK